MSIARNTLTAERKYQLLLEISQRIRETLNLDEILEHLLDTIHTAIRYDAAGVFVLNRAAVPAHSGDPRQIIAGIVQRGFDDLPPDNDLMLMSGRGLVGHVIRTGETVCVPDVRADARYVVGRERTRSEVAVPITAAGETMGALNLECDRLNAFDDADVELLQFFADAVSASIGRAMLHRHLMDQRRLEDQMLLAQEVQSRLLPDAPPRVPGYDIAGVCRPTFRIGGDYFDYLALDEDRLALVIADVSGKGIPAALSMTAFRSILRSQARRRPEPSHLANRVNELLPDTTGEAAYVTCVYGILDRRDGCLAYTNCGHNPPLLVRAGGDVERLERGGLPLGIFTDSRYETGVVALGPGEVVVFYTDGVIENADPEGEEFGVERLTAVARRARHLPARELIEAIVAATRDFMRAETYPDDFTVMVLRRVGPV